MNLFSFNNININSSFQRSTRIDNKISKDEMISQIQIESEHFVKRQMNWFKKDSRIKWIDNAKEATKIVKEFLL